MAVGDGHGYHIIDGYYFSGDDYSSSSDGHDSSVTETNMSVVVQGQDG